MEKETETTQTEHQPLHHVDYKDITRLKTMVNPHARMMGRRRTGLTAKGQRNFARAIKRARFMALMPYIKH
jgi:small subunit ribosomal protein S18